MMHRLYALAFVGYGLLLGYMSLVPSTGTGALWDKALHCTVYLIFVLLGSPLCRNRSRLLWMGLAVFAYGAALEVAQQFVPGRLMSPADLLANGLGVVLGVGLATLVQPPSEGPATLGGSIVKSDT